MTDAQLLKSIRSASAAHAFALERARVSTGKQRTQARMAARRMGNRLHALNVEAVKRRLWREASDATREGRMSAVRLFEAEQNVSRGELSWRDFPQAFPKAYKKMPARVRNNLDEFGPFVVHGHEVHVFYGGSLLSIWTGKTWKAP